MLSILRSKMHGKMKTVTTIEPHYRISQVASLLGVSRGTVYNLLRGEMVVDFARPGRRGIKLVPESTLQRLLEKKRKVLR